MRVSHFGVCVFFSSLTAVEVFGAFAIRHSIYSDPYVFWFLLGASVLTFCFAVLYGKYYIITDFGIVHKLMGIRFRITPWEDIIDIMCVTHQAEKGNGRVLLVTTKKGNAYRPEEHGAYAGLIRQKGFEKDWIFRGSVFMLNCNNNSIKEVIAYIESYYGPIDYNYFERTEKRKQ